LPRPFADNVLKQGVLKALQAAKSRHYISKHEVCKGSEAHYNVFESMITGRNLHAVNSLPKDEYRKLYLANVLREASMAHKVTSLMQ
jgi:hypothetical protein